MIVIQQLHVNLHFVLKKTRRPSFCVEYRHRYQRNPDEMQTHLSKRKVSFRAPLSTQGRDYRVGK